MWRLFEATLFLEEPPEVEYRDGLFHITVHYGETTIRRCYKPNVFLQGMQLANGAIAKWQADQREQVEFIRVFPQGAAERLAAS